MSPTTDATKPGAAPPTREMAGRPACVEQVTGSQGNAARSPLSPIDPQETGVTSGCGAGADRPICGTGFGVVMPCPTWTATWCAIANSGTPHPDYIFRMTERSKKYLFHIVEELELHNPNRVGAFAVSSKCLQPRCIQCQSRRHVAIHASHREVISNSNRMHSGRPSATYWHPPALHWSTYRNRMGCLATGIWPWLHTTGAKAASVAPSRRTSVPGRRVMWT